MQPGKAAEWVTFYGERGLPVQQRLLGRLIGFFTSEIGTLNQVAISGRMTASPIASSAASTSPPIPTGRPISATRRRSS